MKTHLMNIAYETSLHIKQIQDFCFLKKFFFIIYRLTTAYNRQEKMRKVGAISTVNEPEIACITPSFGNVTFLVVDSLFGRFNGNVCSDVIGFNGFFN